MTSRSFHFNTIFTLGKVGLKNTRNEKREVLNNNNRLDSFGFSMPGGLKTLNQVPPKVAFKTPRPPRTLSVLHSDSEMSDLSDPSPQYSDSEFFGAQPHKCSKIDTVVSIVMSFGAQRRTVAK